MQAKQEGMERRDGFGVAEWARCGRSSERGPKTAPARAHDIGKRRRAEFEQPPVDASGAEALDEFVARRTAAGGASPMD